MNIGDKVVCVDRGLGSICVLGQFYTIVKIVDDVIWLDNGAITFTHRFRKL